jgi:hypothetical protein
MLQLIKCAFVLLILLCIFAIWGYSVSKWLKIEVLNLPMQILAGFFAFFIMMQCIILPVVFLHNSLKLAAILCVGGTLGITVFMLSAHRLAFLRSFKKIKLSIWIVMAVAVTGIMAILASLQSYTGFDTAYYIGEMASFLSYGKFWTHDAMAGGVETSVIPLHYALSCFYPFFSVLAYLFGVEVRLLVMYTTRSLCVILFANTAFCWGYELFASSNGTDHTRNGCLFTIICFALSMFMPDYHSAAFMMMVRGYESKGFCAAVVAPMCTLALVKIFRNVKSESNWRLLGLIAWASMPIAMSSMAVIPVAIAVAGISMMIYYRRFKDIFIRCLVCVVPNFLLMGWYIIGSYA